MNPRKPWGLVVLIAMHTVIALLLASPLIFAALSEERAAGDAPVMTLIGYIVFAVVTTLIYVWRWRQGQGTAFWLHFFILVYAAATLVPFFFTLNNSLRTNSEIYREFFGVPETMIQLPAAVWASAFNSDKEFRVTTEEGDIVVLEAGEAVGELWLTLTKGYRNGWRGIRRYVLNSVLISSTTAFGVILFGSFTAYILSRYKFPGSRFIFYYMIGIMMFPAVLTLVPAFMLVKELNLLNTPWALIFPWVAGGQAFALFVFKSFFDGLPEDLFESARIDGAGHFQLYWHIVLPLSKPVIAVVAIMNIIASWNDWLWPFVTQPNGKWHTLASGLYVLARSPQASSLGTLFAAYILSSVPLLILFTYATRPFMEGATTGAFKA
jgi:ABC-type glycerol-3-phosphate transport system permease component